MDNELGAGSHRMQEGIDFYYENGLMVLTREFLLKRGYCCENRCRHCPYGLAPSENQDGKQQTPAEKKRP